jgi:hypothetical protein
MQVSLSYIDLHCFRYMPKSDMAESQLDLFLVFWGPTILISTVVELIYIPTNSLWVFLNHSYQYLLLFVLLMIACLTGVWWNLSVFLICISFMTKEAEHFFMCLLAIWIFSSKNSLFNCFVHVLIGLFVLLMFSFLSYMQILNINPFSVE